jgi:threonine aldolase
VAELLGHEAGLFTPTGSLANVLGVRLLVEPGRELLCDSLAHIVRAELGAHAVTSGITTRTWDAQPPGRQVGLLDPEVPLAMMVPDGGPYLVSTGAVAVENTHNFGGGTVQPLAALRRVREGTADAGVAVHFDGARLWNAHVADGVPLNEYGALADTVSVCLSKGLGAPIGSVLVASSERIARARVWRKRMGAGMRQVGVLAAAGHYALDHHVRRLADDHRRAKHLAEALAVVLPSAIDPEVTRTNIVVLDLRQAGIPAAPLAKEAAAEGVLVSALGTYALRAVTHLDVDDAAVERAIEVLSRVVARARDEASPGSEDVGA